MGKDTKYLQFPLSLLQNLFTDKAGTLNKIFDAAIYNLSMNPKFASDNAAAGQGVLYDWYRHENYLTTYLHEELRKHYADETLNSNGDDNGFYGSEFNPYEIDELIEIMDNDSEFHQAIIEYHQVHKAIRFLEIKGGTGAQVINGKAIVDKIPSGEVWAMINKDLLFDYYKNDKDQWQLVQFAAYIAIGSIIGATKLGFKPTNKNLILARMFGYKIHNDIPEKLNPTVKELMNKYSTRYWMGKLLQELQVSWHVKLYNPKGMRGFTVGNKKASIETMALKAEAGRRAAKIQALKDQTEIARYRALEKLNLQQPKNEY
jgi:hypothetical protein